MAGTWSKKVGKEKTTNGLKKIVFDLKYNLLFPLRQICWGTVADDMYKYDTCQKVKKIKCFRDFKTDQNIDDWRNVHLIAGF